MFPPSDKSLEGVLKDTRERLALVERRLVLGGGGGSGESTTIRRTGDVWQVAPGSTLASGTLWADGSAVSRATYPELFAAIGTTYGNGDGSTTFNLPLLNGKQTIVNGAQGAIDGIFPAIGNSAQYADAWDIFYALDNSAAGGASSELRMQLRANGANLSTPNYNFSRDGLGLAANLQQTSQAQNYVEPSWGGMNTTSGRIRVTRGGIAGRWTDFEAVAALRSGSYPQGVIQMAGTYAVSGAVNGIALYVASGTLTGWIEAIPVGGSLIPSVIAAKPVTVTVYGSSSSGGGGGSYTAQAGLMQPFAGSTVPSGWLVCDGSARSRTGYPELYAAIGTAWGAGDGSTTFNLPDLRGRTVVGIDPAATEFNVLGKTGGSKDHSHLTGSGYDGANLFNMVSGTTLPDGRTLDSAVVNVDRGASGLGHSVASARLNYTFRDSSLQPYGTANWIISTGSGVGGGGSSIPALPDPVNLASASSFTMTGAAGAWVDIAGMSKTLTLPNPAWVRVDFRGQVAVVDGSTYGMIGVAATGALNLLPEVDQEGQGGAGAFGYAPFNLSPNNPNIPVYGSKLFLLPAGTTTLKFQIRRSTTTNSPIFSYPAFTVIPMSWVGAPGAVQDVAITGRATIAANFNTPATATSFVVPWSAFDGYPGMWTASAPSKFVLNKPGKWRVVGKIRMNGTSGFGYVNIWRNGVNIPASEGLVAASSAGLYPLTEDIITSNGADYVEFVATNSNVSQAVVANNCLATFEWIGA